MSKQAKAILLKLLEVDQKKRMRATELLNLEWIQCRDLPLSIYEKAGNILRASELNPNIKFNMKHVAHLE